VGRICDVRKKVWVKNQKIYFQKHIRSKSLFDDFFPYFVEKVFRVKNDYDTFAEKFSVDAATFSENCIIHEY